MSHDCDHIRQRALKHGEGSVEYDLWIRHSRHCPECRNELYIQELLKGDGREKGGAHLSRGDMSRLLQLADERYRGGRREKSRFFLRVLYWGGRVAVFVALLFILYGLIPQEDDDMKARAIAAAKTTAQRAESKSAEPLAADMAESAEEIRGEAVMDDADAPMVAVQASSAAFVPLASTEASAQAPLSSAMMASVGAPSLHSSPSFVPLAAPSTLTRPQSARAEESLSAQQMLSAEPEMFPGWDVDDAVQGIRRRISLSNDRFVESLDAVDVPGRF